MVAIPNREQRTVRHGGSIKIFEISGHIKNTPCPEGTEIEVVRDPAICLGGAFGQGDRPGDGPGQGETAQQSHLQNHLVCGIPDLFVHVKGLGVYVADTFHFPKILEEVPEAWGEILEVPVIHGNTDFIQEQGAVRLWPKMGELLHRDDPDAWNTAVPHIGIDMVALAHIAEHFMHHVAGLACPLLTENEGELVGVVVLPGEIGQAGDSKKKNDN